MMRLRAKHVLLTIAAMFSLFVSAVSACACSHHGSVKVETELCHSSSHESFAAEQSADSNYIETDCNCLVRTPVPAVVAKKDDKRAAVEEQIADVIELPPQIAIGFRFAATSNGPFKPPQSNYQRALLASLPSRAPPRL